MLPLLAALLTLVFPAVLPAAFPETPGHLAAPHVDTLDRNLAPFRARFNAYSDRYRLVVLASPT
jgi:hypothetical protein